MRFQVIGAAGFIGSCLSSELAARGHEVQGLDRAPPAHPSTSYEHLPLDVATGDFDLPGPADAVFYLAQSPGYREFPARFAEVLQVNTLGAARAAYAARRAGTKRFFFASTGNVYRPSFEPLDESAPLRRDQAYAFSKVAAEEALALFRPDLEICNVRFFGVFGPNQRDMLPVRIREKLLAGQPIQLSPRPGEGRDTDGLRISFGFVRDTARALVALAERPEALPLTVNVGGCEAISLRTFATSLAQALGTEASFEYQETPRPFDLVADVGLLRGLVSPSFTSLADAMEETVRPTS